MNLNPSKMYERRPSPTKRPTKNTLLPEVETINTIREEGPVAKTFKPPMLVRTEAFDERRGKGQSYRGAKGGKGGKGRTNGAHGSRFDVEKEDWYMRILGTRDGCYLSDEAMCYTTDGPTHSESYVNYSIMYRAIPSIGNVTEKDKAGAAQGNMIDATTYFLDNACLNVMDCFNHMFEVAPWSDPDHNPHGEEFYPKTYVEQDDIVIEAGPETYMYGSFAAWYGHNKDIYCRFLNIMRAVIACDSERHRNLVVPMFPLFFQALAPPHKVQRWESFKTHVLSDDGEGFVVDKDINRNGPGIATWILMMQRSVIMGEGYIMEPIIADWKGNENGKFRFYKTMLHAERVHYLKHVTGVSEATDVANKTGVGILNSRGCDERRADLFLDENGRLTGVDREYMAMKKIFDTHTTMGRNGFSKIGATSSLVIVAKRGKIV